MLNTQVHEATKHTPYELVFGQPPRSLLVPNATFKGMINEEELVEPNQEENDSIADDHHIAEQDDHQIAEQDNHYTTKHGNHDTTEQGDNIAEELDDHSTIEHNDSAPQAPKMKKPLATLSKHRNVRKKADILYQINAERMKHKHSLVHKVKKFAVEESVGLRIPRIDWTTTDVHRLPCVIVKVVGKAQDMYCLRCCSGVLDKCYRADELEPFAGSYNIPANGW